MTECSSRLLLPSIVRHVLFYFPFFSPTEEKLASKSRPLTYNELEGCVNNSKQLYAEFWVSVDYNNSFFSFSRKGCYCSKNGLKNKFFPQWGIPV